MGDLDLLRQSPIPPLGSAGLALPRPRQEALPNSFKASTPKHPLDFFASWSFESSHHPLFSLRHHSMKTTRIYPLLFRGGYSRIYIRPHPGSSPKCPGPGSHSRSEIARSGSSDGGFRNHVVWQALSWILSIRGSSSSMSLVT